MGNVFTVVWSFVGLSAALVTFLVPVARHHADRYRRALTDIERITARRWTRAVRAIPLASALIVGAISAGAAIALREDADAPTAVDFWLLAVAFVSQVGIACVIFVLVPSIPRSITTLAPASPNEAVGRKSARSYRPTTVRFINELDQPLRVQWIDERGSAQDRELLHPHGGSADQVTYVGHLFLVATVDGRGVALFEAVAESATAVINTEVLNSSAGR